MLKKIRLTNFKAFKDVTFEIRPITIFVGQNNSGKSSFIASLRLLAQTSTSFDNEVPLLLNGPLGEFGTFKDIVNENSIKKTICFEMWFEPLEPDQDVAPSHIMERPHSIKQTIKFNHKPILRQTIISHFDLEVNNKSTITIAHNGRTNKHYPVKYEGKLLSNYLKGGAGLEAVFKHFHLAIIEEADGTQQRINDPRFRPMRFPFGLQYASMRYWRNVEYIGPVRQSPKRSYTYSGERHNKVGKEGENATSIMVMDSLRKGKQSKGILQRTTSWLKKAELVSGITIQNLSDRYYEVYVKNPKNISESQNFADVGYGISQVLPIIVAGYNLEENGTLLVEEPEIHLHPNAQASLGDFFLELYESNKHSIIETHSEHLIMRLQQHVASGMIKNEDIAIYYITNNESHDYVRIDLDELGAFKNDWPEGFFPYKFEEAKKLAKIRMERMTKTSTSKEKRKKNNGQSS